MKKKVKGNRVNLKLKNIVENPFSFFKSILQSFKKNMFRRGHNNLVSVFILAF